MIEETILISIANEGESLLPENIDKLFQPFFTTKTSGSGLGLAIVNNIIKAHNGELSVNRDRTQGAEFVITIPVAGPTINKPF